MKRVPLLPLLAAVMLLLPVQAVPAAEAEPKVGLMAGNIPFSAPLTPEEAQYLGLDKPAPFTLKDIKASYVLIESFNTTCPHCMMQAPVLNRLYEMVSRDAQLKDKVKFLSAGQGNDAVAVRMWKTFHKVPFPVLPDPESKLGKAINFSPYPVTLLVDKSGKVVWVHVGAFDKAEEAFKEIKAAVK
ncbi:MAG: TlpA family protein disulfide reductase [Syntrophobacterales bacterium]|nr:TlpA family protein disulfide reductase [Syntrophobacterales bacterium]